MIFLFDRVENIVEKGENAGYKHFLLFPQCFQMLLSQELYGEELSVKKIFPRPCIKRNTSNTTPRLYSTTQKCLTNKTKSDLNFFYPRDRQHRNVPVTIVDFF